QQIAELHHGQVRVKSDLQGTVFEVELPVGMPKGKKEDEKR
ncbi:MAG TPA: two-component sensor histidine kinase, partial [Lachnospiraceae bacterium]|nr:two-component sensor histidine kinase [Lachnospiraceae bacterium]